MAIDHSGRRKYREEEEAIGVAFVLVSIWILFCFISFSEYGRDDDDVVVAAATEEEEGGLSFIVLKSLFCDSLNSTFNLWFFNSSFEALSQTFWYYSMNQ